MDCAFLLVHQLRWLLAMVLILFVIVFSSVQAHLGDVTHAMPKEEREMLKEEARDMFYHAYRAYMENAYPADELMPLTCCGRWRGTEPSRGDIDDTLGNFSLTLVDTLDTLVILGDLKEFEHAVKLVARDVSFDSDIVVSVFETNIRILGGLLSGHILAEYFQQRAGIMSWYRSELLDLARDVGYRLLPAFNTTTGIPHARINLRYGLKSQKLESSRETCTACAGTMILEMAALSRLTGESIFEEKAHRAMDVLWRMRHRSSDLMGTVLNVHSGDWVRRDSGVGAGIDSYYEYCLKAYILLGDERYLGRFNRHYSAVMKYISQGPMLLDVHMHRPHTNSRNFMDALLAFWPGLQVLKGDIKPAVETHEMLYQVMQRHNFIPEAFTTDFQVHWGQHPLRPEFLESTYFLYRATGDPYYLEVGRNVLRSLQKYARVPCGYAAVKDVRTGVHEDRMDSFVLAETFKYLYLLFADPSDLILDLDEFLFTTEAHLLPLSLARLSNLTVVDPIGRKRGSEENPEGIFSSKEPDHSIWDEDVENARSCPNTLHLFPESVRRPLRNMVDGICPKNTIRRKLRASEYQAGNQDHAKIINDMGITVLTLPDGRVQLLHNLASAKSAVDGEEGMLFMQEMVELSKMQAQQPETSPQAVIFNSRWAAMQTEGSQSAKISKDGEIVLSAGPAHFGLELKGDKKVTARIGVAEPLRVCADLENPDRLHGRIAIIERGDCMFVEKARRVQSAGAVGAIVVDNIPGTSAASSPMFAMSGDGQDDVTIPVVFLFYSDATILLHAVSHSPSILVTLASSSSSMASKGKALDQKKVPMEQNAHEITLEQLKESVHDFLRKKSAPQPSVGVPEVTPVDTGDFHASVEQVGDQELIRITRKDLADSSSGADSKAELTTMETRIELVASEEVLSQMLKKAVAECGGKMDTVADVAQQLLKAYVEPSGNAEDSKNGVKVKPVMASDILLCLTAIENVALVASKEKSSKPSLSPPSSSENNDKHSSVFLQISQNLKRKALLDSFIEVKLEGLEPVSSSKEEDECPEEGIKEKDESEKLDVLVAAVTAERCPLKDRDSDKVVSDGDVRTCESADVKKSEKVLSDGIELEGLVEPHPRDEL